MGILNFPESCGLLYKYTKDVKKLVKNNGLLLSDKAFGYEPMSIFHKIRISKKSLIFKDMAKACNKIMFVSTLKNMLDLFCSEKFLDKKNYTLARSSCVSCNRELTTTNTQKF